MQTATVSSDGKVEQQEKSEIVAAKSAPRTKSVYYASIAYLQSPDDTQLFDRLQEQGDYKRILQEAAEYDYGDGLLDENDHYAVVYNNSVGGTYEVFRKVNEQQIQNTLTRYGLPDNATASEDNGNQPTL